MSEMLINLNNQINNFVWGPITIFILVGFGLYMTLRTKGFQFINAKDISRHTIISIIKGEATAEDKEKGISPYQAMAAAVASSVGVGSIAGVSTAIVAGGPGAVFWMWLSALFGMMTKYSEVVLAIHFRETAEDGSHYGGPMYYMEKGLHSKPLAIAFSAFLGIACFSTGNMTQANSIAASLYGAFGVPHWITGIALAILASLVIFGGVSRITRVSEKLVPVMAIFYIAGSLVVILQNLGALPAVMASIFENAFSFHAAGGGVMGYAIMRAMRFGVARGVLSNEAGLGSAPMLHAAADTDSPVRQGMWGIFEVFITTICICTMTALVVLMSGVVGSGSSGAVLSAEAFSKTFGSFGGAFIAIAIFFFAFSSLLGWCYYGECAWGYIFKDHKPLVAKVVRIIWIPAAFIGCVSELDLVWGIADTCNGLMIIPNIIALFGLSGIVYRITMDYLKNPESVKIKKENTAKIMPLVEEFVD